MATAAAVVALDQQAVIDAFSKTDAVRTSNAIVFEPKGDIQRSVFDGYAKAGIIRPEGSRWYLNVPAYDAARRRQRYKALAVAGLLAAAAAAAALL